nr:uncharacterized protein K02A2.6-like [Dermacentor andersoni]
MQTRLLELPLLDDAVKAALAMKAVANDAGEIALLKRGGSVGICGDFKVSINPVATIEKYRCPGLKIFGQRCPVNRSSRSSTSEQLVLQDTSPYVTISSILGLFKYTRLPFGVASAPAIFHREMDNLFRGMWHVVVYLDDIQVIGSDDGDHLMNLQNILA